MTKREKTLDEVRQIICGDRDKQYGSPEDSFKRISEYWSLYLMHPISAFQVGIMMALLKVARTDTGPYKHDTLIDAIGYLACAEEIAQTDEESAMLSEVKEVVGDIFPGRLPELERLVESVKKREG